MESNSGSQYSRRLNPATPRAVAEMHQAQPDSYRTSPEVFTQSTGPHPDYRYVFNGQFWEGLSNEPLDMELRRQTGITSEHGFPNSDFAGSVSGDLLETSSGNCTTFSNYTHLPVPPLFVSPEAEDLVIDRINNPLRRSEEPWTGWNLASPATRSDDPYLDRPLESYASRTGPDQRSEFGNLSQLDSAYYSADRLSIVKGLAPTLSVNTGSWDDNSYHLSQPHSPFTASVSMSSVRQSQSVHPHDGDDEEEEIVEQTNSTRSRSKASRGGKQTCAICKKDSKCPSDHKKHMLTHDKPHKCDVSGCTRTEGFGTTNDLDRHKASVHKIISKVARKWRCAAPACKDPKKIWPRLDNFKQHLDRMHKNIDVEAMIERSEIRSAGSSPSLTMNNVLGGIGAGATSNARHPLTLGDSDMLMPDAPQSHLQSAPYAVRPRSQMAIHQKSISSNVGSQALSPVAKAADPLALVAKVTRQNLHNSTLSTSEKKMLRDIEALLSKGRVIHERQIRSASSDEDASSDGTLQFPCSFCPKAFTRRCELKKHTNRHTKPYVCTAADCKVRSGSKHDWQRHERGCMQRGKEYMDPYECIRVCCELDPKSHSGKCGFVHTSEDFFRKHLKETHNVKQQTHLEICMRAYQIQSIPGTGWCGFCLKSVPFAETPNKIGDKANEQTGYGSYNGRANHIDLHVSREGRDMDSYVSLEYHLKSKDTKRDDVQMWFNAQRPAGYNELVHNPSHARKDKKRKRIHASPDSENDERKKKLNEAKWTCCQCGNFYGFVLHSSCLDCSHQRCSRCMQVDDLATVPFPGLHHELNPQPTAASGTAGKAGLQIPKKAQLDVPPQDAYGWKYGLVGR